MNSNSSSLINALSVPGNNEANLICFPCAGGSSMTYREWPVVPENCGKYAVELPGRGSLRGESLLRNMSDVVERLASDIQSLPDVPTIFFGHSMGGWVAYELCRKIVELGLHVPKHLVISGSLPIMLNRLPPYVHKMSLEDLQAELRVLDGTPTSVLEDKEMLALFSPAIQADFEIFEKHQHVHRSALDVEVSIWAAVDDPRIPIDLIPMWNQLFSRQLTETYFDGGHMFYDKKHNFQQTSELLSSELVRAMKLENSNGECYAHNRLAS